jgi:hypothetical protein
VLLVIVGAGASYDSIPSRQPNSAVPDPYRLPLADQLFESRELFEGIQRQLPQVMQIAPSLLIRRRGESVEDVLERYASQAGEYGERQQQLAAVRFYLQGIIHGCEENWYRAGKQVATNLMQLIDQIECARRGRRRALYVTFNYDRLIENALENRGQVFASMDDYVRPDQANLIKLHGSVDWMRRIQRLDSKEFGGPAWTIARQIADAIGTLPSPGAVERTTAVPSSYVDGHLALPAIAIPVKNKSAFECPETHLASMKAALKHTRTILTIGWRGAETHFLNELIRAGLAGITGICIAGNSSDAAQTAAALGSVMPGSDFEPYARGFTTFVAENGIERLLNLTWE